MFKKKVKDIFNLSIWNRDKTKSISEQIHFDLAWYVHETNDETSKAIDKLSNLMENKGLSLKDVMDSIEGKEVIFQLLLHRQWIAFHAEALRQQLAQETSTGFGGYNDGIENVAAKKEMEILVSQMSKELEPYINTKIVPAT